MSFVQHKPVQIIFGQGSLNQLSELPMPGKKALIVISNGRSTKANGYLDRCREQLAKAGAAFEVFDEVEPNPLDTTVMRGAAKAGETGCDFIVALGGGSVLDAAKVIAGMATNPGTVWDYMQDGTGGRKTRPEKALPLIAITTTAGTGSEVDYWGVINNDVTKEKMTFSGTDLWPVYAIVDPELMATVPPKFTALQGFDALFHCTEGYISRSHNLMGDMVQLEAIRMVGKYLKRAVDNGQDMEAREGMAFANNLGGTSMTLCGCTGEHGMEHAMSAYHQGLTHGAGLIMISLAYYQYFVDRHVCDDRFIQMAKALGRENASDPQEFIDALAELEEGCGVRDLKMSEEGITEDELDAFATKAMGTMSALFANDPAAMSHDDCVSIFRKAYR